MAHSLTGLFQKDIQGAAVWSPLAFIRSRKSKLVAACSVLLLLSACGGGGGGGAGVGITTITGSAGDGPITAGIISVTDGNGNVVVTTPATPHTDKTAHYSFTTPSSTKLPLTVTIKAGTDTVTAVTQDFNLTGVEPNTLPVGGSVTLNINPIATIIVASARAKGGLNATNVAAATTDVLKTVGFGLPAGFDPQSTKVDTTNIAAVIKSNEAVAELIRRTKFSTGKTFANTIKAIAEDLTDGVINGASSGTSTQMTAKTAGVILTKQAEIAAELLAGKLKITDKSGTTLISAANSIAKLNAAILVTEPTTTGAAANVLQVKVTQKFIDQANNAVSRANILTGVIDQLLNKLSNAINALTSGVAPSGTQRTNISNALTNASTSLATANNNAKAGTNTTAATAPINQNTVLAANITVASGAAVTIASSGTASNTVWLAPANTTNFVAGATMTKAASGTATSITAPATGGTYKLFVIDAVGNVSVASTATVTVDTTPPTITLKLPTPASTGVALNAGINITFSEPMNHSTITTSTFTVKTGGTAVGGSFSFNSGNIVTFTPSANMAASTQYTVAVTSAITDVAGNALTGTSWNFRTAAATYTVGGSVSGLSGTVVLQNNSGDNLQLTSNAAFAFATSVTDGNAYAVTVLTQPSGQTCSVTSGSGSVSGANVTGVTVNCGAIVLIGQGTSLTLTPAVTTLAGTALKYGTTDAKGTLARFNDISDVTTDGTNLFVVDVISYTIRKIVISTGVVTTLAGSKTGRNGSTDGQGALAKFSAPSGIKTDGTNLFVTDRNNNTIREIVISSGVVTTLAGTAGTSGSTDATGPSARFIAPTGITTDGTNLFVTDFKNTIRKIVISSGVVTTLAGQVGVAGSTDGKGLSASFNGPLGLTTDGTSLFVADTTNVTIRMIK